MSRNARQSELSVRLRSFLFNVATVVTIAVFGPLLLLIFLNRALGRRCASLMLRTVIALLRIICGLTFEVRGLANIPEAPVLLASNHQSACDAFLLTSTITPSVTIMKSELLRMFLVGQIMERLGHIPVERHGDARSLARFVQISRERTSQGDSIIIFPEGTRLAPAESAAYKAGVAVLYKELKLPCVPVALNSGHFWPPRSWLRYRGTITIEFLEPLPQDLTRERFLKELRQRIEEASRQLQPQDGKAIP